MAKTWDLDELNITHMDELFTFFGILLFLSFVGIGSSLCVSVVISGVSVETDWSAKGWEEVKLFFQVTPL